jgi:hypothetical protein
VGGRAFPATQLIPLEEHHSPAAVPRHRGRCPRAIASCSALPERASDGNHPLLTWLGGSVAARRGEGCGSARGVTSPEGLRLSESGGPSARPGLLPDASTEVFSRFVPFAAESTPVLHQRRRDGPDVPYRQQPCSRTQPPCDETPYGASPRGASTFRCRSARHPSDHRPPARGDGKPPLDVVCRPSAASRGWTIGPGRLALPSRRSMGMASTRR